MYYHNSCQNPDHERMTVFRSLFSYLQSVAGAGIDLRMYWFFCAFLHKLKILNETTFALARIPSVIDRFMEPERSQDFIIYSIPRERCRRDIGSLYDPPLGPRFRGPSVDPNNPVYGRIKSRIFGKYSKTRCRHLIKCSLIVRIPELFHQTYLRILAPSLLGISNLIARPWM